MSSSSLERRIIIGLIVSTEFTQKVRPTWNDQFIQSSAAKRLAGWCIEYFDEYEKAPYRHIEDIYIEKLRTTSIPKDLAEEIEEDILPDLNEEYEEGGPFNVDYLYKQTKKYFHERRLILHNEEIESLVAEGNLEEADTVAESYKAETEIEEEGLDLSSDRALVEMENAFNQNLQHVVTYPGALGEMWNDQFVRGGFIAFLGPEKRGKTFRLMDVAMRAVTQKANVAFFQAGDMTEAQQLKRIGVYLCKKSDKQKYCGDVFLPIKDCLLSQIDQCDSPERESNVGPLEHLHKPDDKDVRLMRKRITFEELKKAREKDKEYIPCHNCEKWKFNGSIWLKPHRTGAPLQGTEASEALRLFFKKYKRKFKLSTHVSGSLTIKEMRAILDHWEKQDGFVPDLVAVDYADLLEDPTKEFRHKQNQIWSGLRGIPQDRHCLLITATQADADSYTKESLRMSNFSEDKRKLAHVTAMYGLNQDPDDREKKMGLLRINEIVVREDEFSSKNEVFVMQKLQIGRPFLGSFK